MDFSWIFLALFLVAVIRGTIKALSKSMLKNSLRLGAVVVAFLISFALQLSGVFQNAIATVVDVINLAAMLPGFEGATALISALASTVASPFIFIIIFFPILWFLRIVIHFVVKGIEKAQAKKAAEAPAEEAQSAECEAQSDEAPAEEPAPVEEAQSAECEAQGDEAPAEEPAESATCADENPEITVEAEASAEEEHSDEAPAEESAPAEEPAHVEEAPAPVAEVKSEPVKAEKPKKEKKKIKTGLYEECAWKKIISVATGAISSILVFAIVLMPIFYVMSLAVTATNALDDSDADDSQIYKIIDVIDEYIVDPYENSFVYQFYNTIAVTDLLNFTTKSGGKIVLENGQVVYADDVLKTLVAHGVSAAAQITSAKSECSDIKADVETIISNPMVSSLLADVLMNVLADLEMEEPTEDDLMGGLIANFTDYYKNADKATIENDIKAIGGVAGVLAEERILAMLIAGGVDIEALLADEETLGNVVEAISGLSAFGPTVEGAFELGIEMLGDALHIPANDAEVYESFMDDLLTQMIKSSDSKYTSSDFSKIQYFILTVASSGKKVSDSKSVTGYNAFMSYVDQWKKVQSAFAHASEDRSYGYFTIQINGEWYIYDHYDKVIIKYSDSAEEYKNKISPVAGIINALTRYASTKQLTRDNIYTILNSYVTSTSDEVSRELANRILAKDGFISSAVTLDKLLATTDFSAWSDDAVKAQDSRLCVAIIMDLLGIMETLGNIENIGGAEGAGELADYFVVLGATFDVMKQTSCINELPELLIEGLVKSDMISNFIAPSIAFQSIEIVKNNETKTYVDVMSSITNVIKMGISSFGGVIQ